MNEVKLDPGWLARVIEETKDKISQWPPGFLESFAKDMRRDRENPPKQWNPDNIAQ